MIYRLQKRMIRICGGTVLVVFLLIFLGICKVSIHQLNGAMDSIIDNIIENHGRLMIPKGDSQEWRKGNPRAFLEKIPD